MTETTEPLTWLTQEAYDRLKEELDFLSGEGRAEIVKRIEQAREEGDLRENGGYHAAKDEQGKREARIRQLTQLLESAKVGAPPAAPAGIVAPGTIVTAKVAGEDDAVPARLARGRRRRHRGLHREVTARRGDPRPQEGRHRVVQGTERQQDPRRDHRHRAVQRRLSPRRLSPRTA